MKNPLSFPKVAAALDLSAMDEKLIAYSRFMAVHAGAREIYFVHIIPYFIFPEPVGSSFEELMRGEQPIEQRIRRQLAQEIQPLVDELKGVDIKVEVLEGKPQERLLEYAGEYQPDLLILGKKTLSGNSGIIARRIARKVDCALCFVTEKTTAELQHVLVSVDFSEASARALQTAVALQSKLGDVKVTLLHVIDVPMPSYRINVNAQEIIGQMQEATTISFHRFLEKLHLKAEDFQLRTVINDEFDVSNYICRAAVEENADLIIVGAKGHSVFDDVIFGSVTERLISYEEGTPILVVR